jgi:hypothetical protein
MGSMLKWRRPTADSSFCFLEDRTGETQQGRAVGKGADHIPVDADVLIPSLERMGRPDLATVLDREAVVSQDVDLSLSEAGDQFRVALFEEPPAERSGSRGLGGAWGTWRSTVATPVSHSRSPCPGR